MDRTEIEEALIDINGVIDLLDACGISKGAALTPAAMHVLGDVLRNGHDKIKDEVFGEDTATE